jgi:WD40 repeat protein
MKRLLLFLHNIFPIILITKVNLDPLEKPGIFYFEKTLFKVAFSYKLLSSFDKTNGGHSLEVNKILQIYSEHEELLASGSYDSTVKVWNLSDMSLKFTFEEINGGHTGPIQTLAWLTQDLLASGSSDATVKVWDLSTGLLKFSFDLTNGGHLNTVWSLATLESGLLLASGSEDSTVKVWDTTNGLLKYTFDQTNGGHKSTVFANSIFIIEHF